MKKRMNLRKTRKYPFFTAYEKRTFKKQKPVEVFGLAPVTDFNFLSVVPSLLPVVFLAFALLFSACSTNHYFSVSSDSMENPNIVYKDSVTLTKPW